MSTIDEVIALIFDMDGVIVDSTPTHTEAWRIYLDRHGLDTADIADRMLGKHNDELVRAFFPADRLTAQSIAEHGLQKEALYREMMASVVEDKLVPGVKEFIVRNKQNPMAVATNAEPLNVDFVLTAASLRSYFKVVVDGHQVINPKPHPDVYLRAASMLGYDPANCVVFEDSLTGVEAARAAGTKVVGVTTTLAAFADVDMTIRDFFDPKLESWLSEFTVSHS
ncbi:MAG TPA: HAD family phosphatase [Bryobacteraceae bacterium]|nr:HAD family phosphatase [Bryobacteraceae bacterium]